MDLGSYPEDGLNINGGFFGFATVARFFVAHCFHFVRAGSFSLLGFVMSELVSSHLLPPYTGLADDIAFGGL